MNKSICLICSLCFFGCSAVERRACEDFVYGTDTPSRMIDDTIVEFLKKVVLKEHLEPVSFGCDMDSDVQKVSIELQAVRSLNIRKARKFVVQKAHEFLAVFNNNPKIRPFIHEYPCGIQLLQLKIEFMKPDRTPEDAPYVGSALVRSGKIYYKIYDRKRDDDLMTSETYEEACQLITQEVH